jgi:hypothetical protein
MDRRKFLGAFGLGAVAAPAVGMPAPMDLMPPPPLTELEDLSPSTGLPGQQVISGQKIVEVIGNEIIAYEKAMKKAGLAMLPTTAVLLLKSVYT